MGFRGNAALVTGAASGMGQLAAWRLAAEGVPVAALDVDEEGLARTARRAPSIRAWRCDVSDWEAVRATVAEADDALGPIDRVMHAAAIAPTAPLLEQPVEEIRAMTEVNYLGTVHVTKATLPAMIQRGRGDLVLFASLAGWMPAHHFGAYSATKFAVVAFAEILAHENRDSGVRFCCVCPPIVDTPLLEQVGRSAQRLLEASKPIRPEDVLDAIEAGIERGQLFVYPGPGTRVLVWLRRYLPGLLWKRLEDVEAGRGPGALGLVQGPGQSGAEPPTTVDEVSAGRAGSSRSLDPASLFEEVSGSEGEERSGASAS